MDFFALRPFASHVGAGAQRNAAHARPHSSRGPLNTRRTCNVTSTSSNPVQSTYTPNDLVGFTVLQSEARLYRRLKDNIIGTVEQVILPSASLNQAHPLLKVSKPETSGRFGADAQEEHLIPLAKSIVPSINWQTRSVIVDPPKGLLKLGKRRLLLHYLSTELLLYAPPAPGVSIIEGVRMMPTKKQLLEAGRKDVIRMINEAGGFIDVAAQLGFRAKRKPPGYWEDESALDTELAYFVAAHWAKFLDREEGTGYEAFYWYNQITGRVAWEEPSIPQAVDIDEDGSQIFLEADEDRVMPSRTMLLAAGRYDLNAAIKANGGYNYVAELLGRRPVWPRYKRFKTLADLAAELRSAGREAGLARGRMPSVRMLLDQGRNDALRAAQRLGGLEKVAAKLGWTLSRRPRQTWLSIEQVAGELEAYAQAKEMHHRKVERKKLKLMKTLNLGVSLTGVVEGEQDHRGNALEQLAKKKTMPSHEELRAAGRHDLRFAVQKFGSRNLAALLGWTMPKQGHHNINKSITEEGLQ